MQRILALLPIRLSGLWESAAVVGKAQIVSAIISEPSISFDQQERSYPARTNVVCGAVCLLNARSVYGGQRQVD